MKGWPWKAWVYAALLAAGAAAVALAQGGVSGLPGWRVLFGFGALFVLAELVPITFKHGYYSVSFVLVLAALISVGPVGAIAAAAFTALDLSALKREDWFGRMIFNGAQFTLSTGVASVSVMRSPLHYSMGSPSSFPRAGAR